jgi:hypothetical protein
MFSNLLMKVEGLVIGKAVRKVDPVLYVGAAFCRRSDRDSFIELLLTPSVKETSSALAFGAEARCHDIVAKDGNRSSQKRFKN